jgi:hypothetical protein
VEINRDIFVTRAVVSYEGGARYRGAHAGEGEFVRARLVLFIAAAVVFAPGWHTGSDRRAPDAGVSVAGRILAPTVEEANVASDPKAAKASKRLDRSKPRLDLSKVVAWISRTSPHSSPDQLWLVAVAAVVLAVAGRRSSTRAPRAPPHVLTV